MFCMLVTQIYPGRVPVDGGSLVTINGTNLGDSFEKVRVDVNGIQVLGVKSEYETSKRLVNILNIFVFIYFQLSL